VATLPSRIGNFDVLRQIGSGGMGAVYLGLDPELNRQVAIKVIREEVHDQEVLDRFFREARAAAALRHPNIITIYASGQHEHQPYMVMEYVEGESLAEIIRSRRMLTLADKLSYLEQICSGLHFAHRAGIVHRDIKPANIMVDGDGVVRILDFGIARVEGSAMTQDGALIGSLNYMSPEQMLGRPIDQRSDIFSVGSVAYELLCYQQAFKGNLNDGLLHRLPNEDPPPLSQVYPGLSPAIEQVIMRALQKAPDSRFQNLADMRNALLEAQRGPVSDVGEERTMFIPRGGVPRPAGDTTAVTPVHGDVVTPTTPGTFAAPAPPPPTAPSVAYGIQTGAPAGASPPPGSDTPAAPQTWQLKKKPASVPGHRDTGTKRDTTVTRKPPTATTVRPPAAPASSRKGLWIGAAAAGALVIGAVAALPWLTAEPADPLTVERPAIQAAMERFRIGYRNRDMDAVLEAFPTLPPDMRQSMQRTFDSCIVYEVTFDEMNVALASTDPAEAQADVRSTHTCTPQSGGRETASTQHNVFTLAKTGGNWMLNAVARPPAH
jgi:serine/threonine-protein kinase